MTLAQRSALPLLKDAIKRSFVLWNHRRLYKRRQGKLLGYVQWCDQHDALDAFTRQALRERMEQLPHQPAVDLLIPATDPPLILCQKLLDSVRAQIYLPWRLHLALVPDASVEVAQWWRAEAVRDERLRPATTAASGAPQWHALLGAVTAPWCAFIEPGQVWREHTLLLLVEAVCHRPDAALAYGDEDHMAPSGRRNAPWFKGDFDADALLALDAIGAPALWRADSLKTVAAASPLAAAAPSHDLALRGTRDIAARQVVHVPHVLCHRLTTPAEQGDAAAVAVQSHLRACNMQATAEADAQAAGLVRVRFALPAPTPQVTIVIPTRNALHLLRPGVQSILERTTYPAYDITIIDNGSDDPACLEWLDEIAQDPRVQVLQDPRPFNFAALNNAAIQTAAGEFVALVNNDIEILTPDWLQEMVSLAARPGVGAIGARLWFEDGTLQHGGVLLGIGGAAGHALKGLPRGEPGLRARALRLQGYLAVTAACLVVRKSTYLDVGGMDEAAFAVAFNDVDFCLRLAARGWRNLWTPHAEMIHRESVTRGKDQDPAGKRRLEAEHQALKQRWPAWIARDPFYNPNLSNDNDADQFSPAASPRVDLRTPWFNSAGYSAP
jgi:O-antigen biosynthesis protein